MGKVRKHGWRGRVVNADDGERQQAQLIADSYLAARHPLPLFDRELDRRLLPAQPVPSGNNRNVGDTGRSLLVSAMPGALFR
jgi:hypothetical protein